MTRPSFCGSLRAKGFSVIEVLIAVVVSVFVMSGLLQVFINSSNSYRLQSQVGILLENGQFAMQYLTRDVGNTDFWGCLRSLSLVNNQLNSAGNPTYYGYTAGLSGTANASGSGAALATTDTITVSGATNISGGLPLQTPYPTLITSTIKVGAGTTIAPSNILLVSDCDNGDIFQVSSIDATGNISHLATGSPGNLSASFSKAYGAGTFVYRPYTHVYSVQTGANGLPSLFYTDINGSQELVQGVQSMIILYGQDTDGDGAANVYVRANAVTNMDNVVSVRISLLLETLQDYLTDTGLPQSYVFNGVTVTPTDERIRRVYTTTIVLSNRSQ